MEHKQAEAALKLPLAVVSPVDVGRLARELTALNEFLNQAALRGAESALPRVSKLLEELASQNQLDLLTKAARLRLLKFLQGVQHQPAVLHISFAADPSPAFLKKLMDWLRREIHPLVLLRIGLQPSIAAGCVVRTPNNYYDLSLRRHFNDKRAELVKRLEGTG